MPTNDLDLSSWIGRAEVRGDLITPGPAMRLLATLDDVDTVLSDGSTLPPLWHWLYFLPGAPRRELGADGHPGRGSFLPPVDLPRRPVPRRLRNRPLSPVKDEVLYQNSPDRLTGNSPRSYMAGNSGLPFSHTSSIERFLE